MHGMTRAFNFTVIIRYYFSVFRSDRFLTITCAFVHSYSKQRVKDAKN